MNTKIKGYKASYKGICRCHQYEVGKTYTINNIKMCKRGFHFCAEMKDVVKYYLYNKDIVLFEVIGSDEIITDGNKTVCSKIEIVRIVSQAEYTFPLPITEYDNNGMEIHFKGSDGYEQWKKYDENNNLIHYKSSNDFEYWNTYDGNNKLIMHKDSDGREHTY